MYLCFYCCYHIVYGIFPHWDCCHRRRRPHAANNHSDRYHCVSDRIHRNNRRCHYLKTPRPAIIIVCVLCAVAVAVAVGSIDRNDVGISFCFVLPVIIHNEPIIHDFSVVVGIVFDFCFCIYVFASRSTIPMWVYVSVSVSPLLTASVWFCVRWWWCWWWSHTHTRTGRGCQQQ